jgi:hypothetical protein
MAVDLSCSSAPVERSGSGYSERLGRLRTRPTGTRLQWKALQEKGVQVQRQSFASHEFHLLAKTIQFGVQT